MIDVLVPIFRNRNRYILVQAPHSMSGELAGIRRIEWVGPAATTLLQKHGL